MHDTGSFEVRFWHDREAEVTAAQVVDKVLGRVTEASVARHKDDRFEYRKARKFALTKALRAWPRGVRAGFWAEYKRVRPQDMA